MTNQTIHHGIFFSPGCFFTKPNAAILSSERAGEYSAGTILLAAVPLTAMVFVFSYLSDGDPACTLVASVVIFVVIPLRAGFMFHLL